MDNANGRGIERWGVLAAWAGVILSLVFGVGAAVVGAFAIGLGYVHARGQRMEEREIERVFELGRLTEKVERNADDVRLLDVGLQREIGQVNATTRAEVEGMEGRFQAELGTVSSLHIETIARLRQILDELRDAQLTAVGNDARYDAEIKWIEAAIKALEERQGTMGP